MKDCYASDCTSPALFRIKYFSTTQVYDEVSKSVWHMPVKVLAQSFACLSHLESICNETCDVADALILTEKEVGFCWEIHSLYSTQKFLDVKKALETLAKN